MEKKTKEIQDKVGNGKVFLAISGGVDSSVVAKLLQKSKVKTKLIFIDNGLICTKKNKITLDYFKSEFGEDFVILDRKEIFFEKLKGITDPEQKRKIIGNEFFEIFKEEINKCQEEKFLAQGTIHSDLIESGKKNKSHTIKTHHNTIEELKKEFNLVEPLSDLFKDEVRELGRKLNLPEYIIGSQPFPGPGYALRVMGEVTPEKVEIVKKADEIFKNLIIKHKQYDQMTQSFTVLINVKAVGVSGDQRKYGNVISLRAIKSEDLMTASIADIPMEILKEVSYEIINQIPEVTKVVYDISSKPPSTIE